MKTQNMQNVVRSLVDAKNEAYTAATATTDAKSRQYYQLIDMIQSALETAQNLADKESAEMTTAQGPTWMDLV